MRKLLLAFLMMLPGVSAHAALAVGASSQGSAFLATSAATTAVTTASTGSTFIIFSSLNAASTVFLTPTDNMGNAYTQIPASVISFNSTGNSGSAWICANCAGGAGHVFTANFTTTTLAVVFAVEITGGAVLDQVLGTTPGVQDNVTTAPTPSITPTQNGAVVLSLLAGIQAANTTITDATGYNNILQANPNGATTAGPIGGVGALVQTTAGATNDIFTIGAVSNVGTVTLSLTLPAPPPAGSGPSGLGARVF